MLNSYKKFILSCMAIMIVAGLLCGNGYAYTDISGAKAYAIYQSNKELIIIDVRDEIEYCRGHIPCAIFYSWNHGVFAEEFHNLPTDAPILLVCRSGNRSGKAAAILDQNGYKTVYNLEEGMRSWPESTVTCDEVENCE
jgi:rhodanese-related sulfurtransferase